MQEGKEKEIEEEKEVIFRPAIFPKSPLFPRRAISTGKTCEIASV
jgi:hypothetical protein